MTLLEKTEALFHSARRATMEAIISLYQVKETEAWREKYDSLGEFIDELGISRSAASKLFTVHTHYLIEGKISLAKLEQVDVEKLYLATSLTGSPKEQFEKALVLSRAELKEQKVFEETGQEHQHEYYCRICHHKYM